MRKFLSILFSLVLLVPAIKISLDRHYCGGELSGVKISISGKPATCGMEDSNHPISGSQVFNAKCCEDQITIFNLDYRYYPETPCCNNHKITKDIPHEAFDHIPSFRNYVTQTNLKFIPPGRYFALGPEQAEICLFRI
jgi:hypothetical protein